MAYEVLKDPVKRARYLALYRVQFRHETPKHQKRYDHRHATWEEKVRRAEERGRQRGERDKSRPPSKDFDDSVAGLSLNQWTWLDFIGDLLNLFWFW